MAQTNAGEVHISSAFFTFMTENKKHPAMQILSDDFTIEKVQPECTFKEGSVLHLSAADPHYGQFALTADKLYFFFDPDIDANEAPRAFDLSEIQEVKSGILKTFYIIEKDGTRTKLGCWKKKEIIAAIQKRMQKA